MGYSNINRPNSLLVVPEVDDVIISSIKANGILCIEAKAKNFFEWLDKKIPLRLRRTEIIESQSPRIAKYSSEMSKQSYIKFRNQFHQIIEDETYPRPDYELHDFYAGDPPEWWDIKNNNDAILTETDAFISDIKKSSNIVSVISGSAGCGKTTALKRIAFNLSRDKYQVYYYEDEGAIDVASSKIVLRTTKGINTIVIVDNAADYIDNVNILIKDLDLLSVKNKLNVQFILAERDNRMARVFAGLRSCAPFVKNIDAINRTDIKLLIAKLTEKDKLRLLRDLDEEKQIAFFFFFFFF